jgi:hypothetical protein
VSYGLLFEGFDEKELTLDLMSEWATMAVGMTVGCVQLSSSVVTVTLRNSKKLQKR